jgi:hypothetical protein
MPSRQRLSNRRPSTTFDFEAGGLRYTATVSRFADGRLGEIFLANHKPNSAADVNARDAAIICSLALQHGTDLEVIRGALTRNVDGEASGPLAKALDIITGGDHA